MTQVEGMVERYNPAVKIFRIRYASHRVGDDDEDLDLMTLQDVLIKGKQYDDARADWGRTRDERIRATTFLTIFEEALEERRYNKGMTLIGVKTSRVIRVNATMHLRQERRYCTMTRPET